MEMRLPGRIMQRWRRDGLTPPRTRKGVPYTDPLHAGRHPFQTYLLALCVISGIPLLFGRVTAGSIEEALPAWLAFCWGTSLILGSLTALIGSYWQGDYANGLTLERAGLGLVGSAAVTYSMIIVVFSGWQGFLAACLILGFGLSCLVRARDIGRIVHTAIQDVKAQP